MNSKLQSREYVLARGRDIVARGGRLVSRAGQLKRTLLGITQHALTVHGDEVTIGEEARIAGLVGRSRNLGGADDLEDALHSYHHLDRFSAAVGADSVSVVNGAQQHFFATTATRQQANANFH